jgi:hypothetical protein
VKLALLLLAFGGFMWRLGIRAYSSAGKLASPRLWRINMFSLIELIITALSAVILLVAVIGLVLMVAHVYRLTQRVRKMEEQLREAQQEPVPNFDPKDRM